MLIQSIRGVSRVAPTASIVWRHTIRRMMSDNRRPDHLQRTVSNTRAAIESPAVVKSIIDLSTTVKLLKLQVRDKNLGFLAGQWVDFSIPGVDTVGGYSMCSAPHTLEEHRELDLAVKFSKHPPAHWVHTQCCSGSEVTVRVGGDFFYAPSDREAPHALLLVAGGVGVNPVYSILQHAAHRAEKVRVSFLYSARTPEELIFKEHIHQLAESNRDIHSNLYITRDGNATEEISLTYGRITKKALEREVQWLQQGDTPVTCYICGPGPMIDSMETCLQEIGLDQKQIIYEKWW